MECCKKIITRTSLIKEWRCAVSLTFLLAASVYATWNVARHNTKCLSEIPFPSTIEVVTNWFQSMKAQNLRTSKGNETGDGVRSSVGGPRKLLGGLGSSPPRCNSKCGRCKPCKPVHVPVPPGKPVTTEYYPEAWRCKCGNKLYMP